MKGRKQSTMAMEKAKALEMALSQIEKDFGKGAIMRLGDAASKISVSTIPSGCLELDFALGVGGIPRGRIIEIYGPESSGKTTIALHIIAEAQKLGAMMLFGEKYGDEVRVVDIGASRELCGGTHVQRTGDIGPFCILSEGGIAAGVRRIEAVTGDLALSHMQQVEAMLGDVAGMLKVQPANVVERVSILQDELHRAEKELSLIKSRLANLESKNWLGGAIDIKGVKLLTMAMEGSDIAQMRENADSLRDKLKSAVVVLASVTGEGDQKKVSLIAAVTQDLTGKIKAGELVNMVAQQVGGKGGGRPDMAQAGGTDYHNLPMALASVKN